VRLYLVFLRLRFISFRFGLCECLSRKAKDQHDVYVIYKCIKKPTYILTDIRMYEKLFQFPYGTHTNRKQQTVNEQTNKNICIQTNVLPPKCRHTYIHIHIHVHMCSVHCTTGRSIKWWSFQLLWRAAKVNSRWAGHD